MAATVKRKRSKTKRRQKRGSDRYDKTLTKFKTMKKNGGSFLTLDKESGEQVPSHSVTAKKISYKGTQFLKEKEDK